MSTVSSYVALAAPVLVAGCTTSDTRLDAGSESLGDVQLWQVSVTDPTFNELRCDGLSSTQATDWQQAHFAEREHQIEGALTVRYGSKLYEGMSDVILIGRKCPFYRGAIRMHERHLRALELRLNLRPPHRWSLGDTWVDRSTE